MPSAAPYLERYISHKQLESSSAKLSQTCYIYRMKWEIKYHDEKLQSDVLALPSGILARYFHCTDRMVEFAQIWECLTRGQ